MKELPKGVRIDKGYVQIRIFHKGQLYCKNFGRDSLFARECASIALAEKRKEILLGKFTVEKKIEHKKFKDVAAIYFSRWANEVDPEGHPKHTEKAKYNCQHIIDKSLLPFFGNMVFDSIVPADINSWREGRVAAVLGTTANREQNVLSSIFSNVERWVKTEQIKVFELPKENPCQYIAKARIRRRERILSTQELKRLKDSCVLHKDEDLWEVCKMALKSLLRKKDLMRLENGESIDMDQAKTGVRIQLPVQILRPLNYINFRRRWEAVRKAAALDDCQFRDLRKTGANLLKMKGYSTKLMSEFLGHTNTDTTELYLIKNAEHLRPLANDLYNIVESI